MVDRSSARTIGHRGAPARGLGLLLCLAASTSAAAQMPTPAPTVGVSGDPSSPFNTLPPPASAKPRFEELDLLRKSEFRHASAAVLSVRVTDKGGSFVPNLGAGDFAVLVNGTMRKVRMHARGDDAGPAHLPVVLLVFPPNQMIVHSAGIRDAVRYFTGQAESMPWKVGIVDANGAFTPFTSSRTKLLATLEVLRTTKEPLQFTGYGYWARSDSNWLEKTQNAISAMERSDGPRLIVAMNRMAGNDYEPAGMAGGISTIALDGPASLVAIAKQVGAHIYIDSPTGPETSIPDGDAARLERLRGLSGPYYPNRNLQALNYFAYANSLTMLTAEETMGGFSNSLSELAAKMQRDLDSAYVLEIDLTPADQDRGIPMVEVTPTVVGGHDDFHRHLKMAMIDLAPLRVSEEPSVEAASKLKAGQVLKAMHKPLVSPDFRITQRVDFFPVRAGGAPAPVLPMSCLVEWTGKGPRPEAIAVAESIVDQDLAQPLLERELDADWQARSVRWERDGQLHPGHYLWQVAVHDASGKILSSARETFTVEWQAGAALTVSSLVTGAECRRPSRPSALKSRPTGPQQPRQITADPLALEDCRLVPSPVDSFATGDTLHAMVRVYPNEKLGKNRPEAWAAHFTLRSKDGAVEAARETPLSIDSNTGLVAALAMPLDGAGITPGEHLLEVELSGPGIKKAFHESRSVRIAAPEPP